MTRFRLLTDAEARSLTRDELLGRLEAEQQYWLGKGTMSTADREAEREFRRIMRAYLDPAAAVRAALDTVRGKKSDYWETRPGQTREGTVGLA